MLLDFPYIAPQSDPVRSALHDVELLEGDIRACLLSFKVPTAIARPKDQNQAPKELVLEDCPGLLGDLGMLSHVFQRQRFVGLPSSNKTLWNTGRKSVDGYRNQCGDDKEILHDAACTRLAGQNPPVVKIDDRP